MKTLLLIALTATLALAQASQEERKPPPQAQNAPDLYVLSVSAFGPNRKREATFSIEVKNTGQKIITAIDWEYVSEDASGPTRGYVIAKFRNSDLKIRPGEKQKLSRALAYDGKQVTGFRVNKIRIMRVEFQDATAWERPAEGRPAEGEAK